jgi:hypothetical protein
MLALLQLRWPETDDRFVLVERWQGKWHLYVPERQAFLAP